MGISAVSVVAATAAVGNMTIPEFKPLNSYGDWVCVTMVRMNAPVRKEVHSTLMQQIDGVIPAKAKYRRCIMFNTVEDIDTLVRTITWKYTPNMHVIEEELNKIGQALQQYQECTEYKVDYAPSTNVNGTGHFRVYKRKGEDWEQATPWMFLTKDRANAWIDKQQTKEAN